MAMSPPRGPGNERTSVGLSLRRKRRLSARTLRLEVIRITTSPLTPASFCARGVKRCRTEWLMPSTGLSKMITSSQKQSGRAKRPSRTDFTKLLLQRRFLRLLSFADIARQLQRQLLVARPFIVSANNPLDQMMPYHILFCEVIE